MDTTQTTTETWVTLVRKPMGSPRLLAVAVDWLMVSRETFVRDELGYWCTEEVLDVLARARDAPFYEALDTWLEDILLGAGVPLFQAEVLTYGMIKEMKMRRCGDAKRV